MKSILDEAKALVEGDRQDDYGNPLDNWTDIAKGWSVVFGTEVTPEQCALAMVWMKVCREINKPKRDNRRDGAGYFDVTDKIISERERRTQNGNDRTHFENVNCG